MRRFLKLSAGIAILILICLYFLKFSKNSKEIIKPLSESQNKIFTKATPTPTEINIALAGEMIFARTAAKKILAANDYKLPFYKIKPILDTADIRFATLEAPLIGKNTPCDTGCMVFKADEENIVGLKYADINVVSLAANHIMDGGVEGLSQTIQLLNENKIDHIGAGGNASEAALPVIETVNGIRIGFLGYTDIPPIEYSASQLKAGSNWIVESKIISDIKNLRPNVDLLIVSLHWGVEYVAKPTIEEINLAHTLIDNGVDVIAGDHPHWIRSIEIYKDKPIFYGLGNFVFDQMWSQQTQKGIITIINYKNAFLNSISIHPFRIIDYVQPVPMEGLEKERELQYIYSISDTESVNKLKYLIK